MTNRLRDIVIRMPTLQSIPMLRRASLEAKVSEANPVAVENPQKQMAFTTLFQTMPKSPFWRRKV